MISAEDFLYHVRNVLGDQVSGVSDDQIFETYVPSGTQFLDRSIAGDKKEAAINQSAWMNHQKGRREPEIYRVKSEPIGDGISVVVPGGTLRGTANLALNAVGGDRRRAAESMLDLYLELNPELVRKEVINSAKDKYARINQLMGKETHHMLEIDGTNAILNAMPPEEKLMAAQRLLGEGFGLGDAAKNQVALFGASDPGPAGSPSMKAYPEQNEHQGVVHSEGGFKAVADQFGFPSLRNTVEKDVDTSVPRWAKTPGMKAMVAGLRQLEASGPRTVKQLIENQPNTEARMAVADQYGAMSRLAVQEAKGIGRMADGNTDKNNSAIRRSLNKLDESYRTLAGNDVADYERSFLGNLGIDLDDEILRNRPVIIESGPGDINIVKGRTRR